MYIEESFDTILNMGYGSGKSPMDERFKVNMLNGWMNYFVHSKNLTNMSESINIFLIPIQSKFTSGAKGTYTK